MPALIDYPRFDPALSEPSHELQVSAGVVSIAVEDEQSR